MTLYHSSKGNKHDQFYLSNPQSTKAKLIPLINTSFLQSNITFPIVPLQSLSDVGVGSHYNGNAKSGANKEFESFKNYVESQNDLKYRLTSDFNNNRPIVNRKNNLLG